MSNEKISNLVKRYRYLKSWTQKKLEDESQVTGRTISKIESDPGYEPTGLIKSKIAMALGENIETVFPEVKPLRKIEITKLKNWLSQKLAQPSGPGGVNHQNHFTELPFLKNGELLSPRATMRKRFQDGQNPYTIVLGESGGGKTWLSLDVAKLAEENNLRCVWVPVHHLMAGGTLVDCFKAFVEKAYPELFNTILKPGEKNRVLWILDGVEHLTNLYGNESEFKQNIRDFLCDVSGYNLFESRCFVLITCNQLFRSIFEEILDQENIFDIASFGSCTRENQKLPKAWFDCWKLLRKGQKDSLDSYLKDDLVTSLTTTPLLCSLLAKHLNESELDPNELLPKPKLIHSMVKDLYYRHWNRSFLQVCPGGFEYFMFMLSEIAFNSLKKNEASFCLADVQAVLGEESSEIDLNRSDLKLRYIFSHFTIVDYVDEEGSRRFQFNNSILFAWLIAVCKFQRKEISKADFGPFNNLPDFTIVTLKFLTDTENSVISINRAIHTK